MDINKLSIKLDKILKQQELILSKLENKIVLENNIPTVSNALSKKQKMEERVRSSINEMIALRPHARRLQQQFNLLVPPHNSRIKAYLKTNDPKVFEDLKRNL